MPLGNGLLEREVLGTTLPEMGLLGHGLLGVGLLGTALMGNGMPESGLLGSWLIDIWLIVSGLLEWGLMGTGKVTSKCNLKHMNCLENMPPHKNLLFLSL